jgi:hypothetical protein
MHRPGRRLAGGDGHANRVQDELGAQVVGHRPAHDLAAEGVDHDGEVDEALPGAQIADVGDPQLIGDGSGEVAFDPIRCGRGRDRAAALLAAPAPVHSLDRAQPHQSSHPLAIPAVPAVADFCGQPAGAIDPAVLDPGGPRGLDRVGLSSSVAVGPPERAAQASKLVGLIRNTRQRRRTP